MKSEFTVLRHSGGSGGKWRVILKGSCEQAEAEYSRTLATLRQGGVELTGPDGAVIKRSWAPRLRTRW